MNNNKNMIAVLQEDAGSILAAEGRALDDETIGRLQTYLDLVHNWNPVAGLVSRGDAESQLAEHILDSLSLANTVAEASCRHHLDIGSGGGFPAIPLAILLPEVAFLLVERGMRKCGFLTKAIAELGLENVAVEQIGFPKVDHPGEALTLTARAVERAAELHKTLADWMQHGDQFLNQSGRSDSFDPTMFHVEQNKDAWTDSGLRRGSLSVVTRKTV